jgi:proton-dependent oligopeptide transporter, POT family
VREESPIATAAAQFPSGAEQKTWFGHPRGLFFLFFTEMWERFSYYGMRSLLVLYMVDHLLVHPDVGQRVLGFNAVRGFIESLPWVHALGPLAAQPLSSQIYGLYTAFVYLTPFFGGMLADRVLGQRRTVILGAILMAIGHFLMASEHLFFLALIFLILGNGAFKPNISTQVGLLYPQGDPRRDGAFTIFYMGINLGAFFSPLVCGTLGQEVGWHWGFGAAGVGMVLGLILYLIGQKHLATDQLAQRRAEEKTTHTHEKFTKEEGLRILALVVICTLNIVFWGVYEQQGNTLQIFADRNTNWSLFGLQIPSTWYQAFNPAMIFIFAPVLNIFWGWQAGRKREPSSVVKMGLGCLMVGLGFIVMILAARGMTEETRLSVLWLAGATLVFTIGELYLSPIGLSFVTKIAPARMVSMLMGVWFLANFFGNYLSGYLGTFYERMPHQQYFFLLTVLGVGAGLVMLLLSRPLDKVVAKHDRGEA